MVSSWRGQVVALCIEMEAEAEVVRWGLISAGWRNVFGVSSENSSVLH